MNHPFRVATISLVASLLCYITSVASCKAKIQIWGFSLPMLLSTALTLVLVSTDALTTNTFLADLFEWNVSKSDDLFPDINGIFWIPFGIIGWATLQILCRHIWLPSEEPMAKTAKLFCQPLYCGILLEQSLLFTRRRTPIGQAESSQRADDKQGPSRIIVCATMWHETRREMTQIMRSLLRLDAETSALRTTRALRGKSPSSLEYELEAHIFLDDAFDHSDGNDGGQLNTWVQQLIDVISETASFEEYSTNTAQEDCRYKTPYGGRIVWKLGGGTLLTAHLKDSTKIRKKKRWSQVMYMGYFLFRQPVIDQTVNHITSQSANHNIPKSTNHATSQSVNHNMSQTANHNTFLLALDGDVDFQPAALQKLLDRMRRDVGLGAACGRIHPIGIGAGPILWYQRFEYSVSHWLQKATEDVIGCVLCSPGCFSLYRASALNDVFWKYSQVPEQAQHYVKYDQGEDRWLCTLLLQRGYRIEYSAASDAFTFAPEGFEEFFKQRKRWNPSTLTNTFDIIKSWRSLTKENSHISSLFLLYQTAMLLCFFITPGTTFLIILGAIHLAFPAITLYGALTLNILPVAIFVVACFQLGGKIQLKMAGVLTVLYTFLMMIVLVGLLRQSANHGFCSVTNIFLMGIAAIFCIAALLHPREFLNVFFGTFYFFFIPAMSMLLIIYSLCNLNDISWGTRETARVEESNGVGKKGWRRWMEQLCRRPCCTITDKRNDSDIQTAQSLERIERKLDGLIQGRSSGDQTDGTVPARSWMNQSYVQGFSFGELSGEEHQFWKQFISDHLKPLQQTEEHQKKMKMDLKDLRNSTCLLFLIANGLFVILFFTLQSIAESTRNLIYVLPCENDKFQGETFEPISFAFLLVFGVLLVIQFIGMLFHRMSTFLHIISGVDVYKRKKKDASSGRNSKSHSYDVDKHVGGKDVNMVPDDVTTELVKLLQNPQNIKGLDSDPTDDNNGDTVDGSNIPIDCGRTLFEKLFFQRCKKLKEGSNGTVKEVAKILDTDEDAVQQIIDDVIKNANEQGNNRRGEHIVQFHLDVENTADDIKGDHCRDPKPDVNSSDREVIKDSDTDSDIHDDKGQRGNEEVTCL